MLEVELERGLEDRRAVILALRKFGPVIERNKIRTTVKLDTHMGNARQVRLIPGVRAVHDGDGVVKGAAQTHTVARSVQRSRSDASLNALDMLGIINEPYIRKDILYAQHEYNLPRSGDDGAGVVIGIVDSGVVEVSELTGRFLGTIYNEYPADGIQSHGTVVAVCAAGASFGLAPGAELVSARGLDVSNSGTNSGLIDCMDAVATRHDANPEQHFCNCSFESSASSFDAAVLDLADSGVPTFVAAGNSGWNLNVENTYPAESPYAFTVGGMGVDRYRHPDSNYGNAVNAYGYYGPHVSMDGFGNWVTGWTGTSFASPMVCGAAASVFTGRSKMTTLVETLSFYSELMQHTVADIKGSRSQRRFRFKTPIAHTLTRTAY